MNMHSSLHLGSALTHLHLSLQPISGLQQHLVNSQTAVAASARSVKCGS